MKKVLIVLCLIVIIFILLCVLFYNFSLSAISKNNEEIIFKVNEGDTLSFVINKLATDGIIRSELVTKVYTKFSGNDFIIQIGEYKLNKNMSTKEILEAFNAGLVTGNSVLITFKEGNRLVDYIKLASIDLEFSYEEAIELLADETYLNNLISNYWFLTSEILDKDIYYPLEGYLFPDTYEFLVGATVSDVVTAMLDNMLIKLEPYKSDVSEKNLTLHQMLTLASMIENEAKTDSDRAMVSQIFLNRINSGWSLGSDVTTYYGAGKVFGDVLTVTDLNDCTNKYNTRCVSFVGLPIGPINSPSLSSIVASINPTDNNYMYFVADCSGKTYFNTTSSGHSSIIASLKSEDNWCDT